MKLKIFLFSLVIGTTIFYSCKKTSTAVTPFDHAAQSLLDDIKINEFLQTHYYIPPTTTENFGVIDTILQGETPLIDIVQIKTVDYESVTYNLYYVIALPEGAGIHPTTVDRVFTKYKGVTIDNNSTVFDEASVNYRWFNLAGGVIPGWTYGIPVYKDGSQIISGPDQPIEFEQPGKGVLFIPSGLAYKNLGSGSIPANTPLLFHIVLGDIQRSDLDTDGIYSIYEDLNQNGIFTDDDSDKDGKANYVDSDDDNDGLLTAYESADPNLDFNSNDALDTDGDNTPNFLDNDDDGDGIITALEDPDPNHDGNPDDALDSDGDNIPDYLDPTN